MEQSVACDRSLGAFDATQKERYRVLTEHVERAVVSVEPVTDGIALRYPADAHTILQLAEFITLERLCCPFFDFDLRLPADADAVELRLTGGPDVQRFLLAELQSRSGAAKDDEPARAVVDASAARSRVAAMTATDTGAAPERRGGTS